MASYNQVPGATGEYFKRVYQKISGDGLRIVYKTAKNIYVDYYVNVLKIQKALNKLVEKCNCVENVPETRILGEVFSDSVAPQRGPGDLHLVKRQKEGWSPRQFRFRKRIKMQPKH